LEIDGRPVNADVARGGPNVSRSTFAGDVGEIAGIA
jgi:hypothetical protein